MEDKTKKESAREASYRDLATDLKRIDKALNVVHTVDGKHVIIGQYTKRLHGLISFMESVVYGDDLPYAIEEGPTRKKVRIESRVLADGIENLMHYVELFSADLVYAPQLKLFFEHVLKHPLLSLSPFNRHLPIPDGRVAADVANDFVLYLRAQGKKIRIRQKIADWKRTTNENRERVRTYVPALLDRYSRLLVVRLDVNYRKAMVSVDEIQEIADKLMSLAATDVMSLMNGANIDDLVKERETLARVDIREVKKDLAHFFRNTRGKPSLFEHMVGHIWSIEFSRVGGYHVHLALFFNGSEVEKDAWYGDKVGEYIEDVITEGRAVVHNCNRDREKYGERWAIGMVEYFDTEKREKLMRVLDYLAKDSQSVYVKPAKGSQMFGTGQLPDDTPKPGPKRSK